LGRVTKWRAKSHDFLQALLQPRRVRLILGERAPEAGPVGIVHESCLFPAERLASATDMGLTALARLVRVRPCRVVFVCRIDMTPD
jgi:hypothetical protein